MKESGSKEEAIGKVFNEAYYAQEQEALTAVREQIEKEGYKAQKQGVMIRPEQYRTAFQITAWNIGYDRAWQETEK